MKKFDWFTYNIHVKKEPSESEGYVLYQEFLDMIDWNYQQGLLTYHPVIDFYLRTPEWPIKGDPFLITNDIYDMAISLIKYNTRWVFSYDNIVVADKTKVIHEGQHRYLALKLLIDKGLIGEGTGILALDYDAFQYDFLWSDTFKDLFNIDPLQQSSNVIFKDKTYAVASKSEGKLVNSIHHLLTWAHGVFKDRNALVHRNYNNIPIIDFEWIIEPDKVIEILEKEKEEMLQTLTSYEQENIQYSDLKKIEIYKYYKHFIERTALSNAHKQNAFANFYKPWDIMIQPEICADEIKRFKNFSDDAKLELITKIKKFNYPLPVIVHDHVLVSEASVFFVLLMRYAVEQKLISANTLLLTVQAMGADTLDYWIPGHLTYKEFMQNYLTLQNKTKTKTENNIIVTELPGKTYHLLLYKINRLFKNDDIIWLLPDDQKLLVVKNYKDKKDSVKK